MAEVRRTLFLVVFVPQGPERVSNRLIHLFRDPAMFPASRSMQAGSGIEMIEKAIGRRRLPEVERFFEMTSHDVGCPGTVGGHAAQDERIDRSIAALARCLSIQPNFSAPASPKSISTAARAMAEKGSNHAPLVMASARGRPMDRARGGGSPARPRRLPARGDHPRSWPDLREIADWKISIRPAST